ELLHDGILARKERTGEIEREGGINVKIIPFDEVADRADEDGLQASLYVGELQVIVEAGRCGGHQGVPSHCCAHAQRRASLRVSSPQPPAKAPLPCQHGGERRHRVTWRWTRGALRLGAAYRSRPWLWHGLQVPLDPATTPVSHVPSAGRGAAT